MKKYVTFVLFILGISVGLSQTFEIPEKPRLQTSIYDYADLLNKVEKQKLEQKLIRYSDSTSTQVVIGIIKSSNGEDLGLLTPRWAHQWGIGDEEKDNGVLVLLAHSDRKIWISAGYGVEHKLTAGVTGELIRNIILPEFRNDDYYSGLDKGTTAIFRVLNGTYKGNPADNETNPFSTIFIFIIIFIIILILSKKNKGGRKNGNGSGDFFDPFILSHSGRSSFGGSSFGGSGGFSGGFGGGGFSGGGAGGSW